MQNPTNLRSYIFFLILMCLSLAQQANSQATLAGDGDPTGLSTTEQAQLLQTVQESISSKSTNNGVNGIPKHELYMSIFAEILISPQDAYGFTSDDWDVITSLPSHRDKRFRVVTDKEMKSFCDFVETEKRDTLAAALDIATRYEKAKKATKDLFNNHYHYCPVN